MLPRITRPASWQQDEGIVQPLSKDRDQLSRRLHHTSEKPPFGGFLFTIVQLSMQDTWTCPIAFPDSDTKWGNQHFIGVMEWHNTPFSGRITPFTNLVMNHAFTDTRLP